MDLDIYDRTRDACWSTTYTSSLQTPTVLTYLLTYTNTSTVTQQDVKFRFALAAELTAMPHTTRIFNDRYPEGKLLDTDALTSTGFLVGAYAPKANAFIEIDALTPAESLLGCGTNLLTSQFLVQPKLQDHLTNGADILIRKLRC